MPTGPCFHTQQQNISSKGKWCQEVHPACLLWEEAWSTCKEAIFQLSGWWGLSSVTSWDNRPT
jgi:hypothetical protein